MIFDKNERRIGKLLADAVRIKESGPTCVYHPPTDKGPRSKSKIGSTVTIFDKIAINRG